MQIREQIKSVSRFQAIVKCGRRSLFLSREIDGFDQTISMKTNLVCHSSVLSFNFQRSFDLCFMF